MLLLTFGLDVNENWISVDAVKSGKTALLCPFCKNQLIAKKGRVKTHHFAHDGETCRESSNAIKASLLPAFDHFQLLDKAEQKYIDKRERYSHRSMHYFKGFNNAVENLSIMGILNKQYSNGSVTACRVTENLKRIDKKLIDNDEPSQYLRDILTVLDDEAWRNKPSEVLKLWDNKDVIATQFTNDYKENKLSDQSTVVEFEKAQRFWFDCHYKKVEALTPDFLPLLNAKLNALNEQSLYLFQFEYVPNGEFSSKKIVKIGMTTRAIKTRLLEVESEFKKHNKLLRSKVLAVAKHGGRIERLLHKYYKQYQQNIHSMTEFFYLSESETKALSLQIKKAKIQMYHPPIKKSVSKNKKIDTEIKQVKKVGRKKKSNADLLNEYKEIANLLKAGKGVRETARLTNTAINTIRRVNAALAVS